MSSNTIVQAIALLPAYSGQLRLHFRSYWLSHGTPYDRTWSLRGCASSGPLERKRETNSLVSTVYVSSFPLHTLDDTHICVHQLCDRLYVTPILIFAYAYTHSNSQINTISSIKAKLTVNTPPSFIYVLILNSPAYDQCMTRRGTASCVAGIPFSGSAQLTCAR